MTTTPDLNTLTFPFGKYKGMRVLDIQQTNPGYLDWIAGKEGFPQMWRMICAKLLNGESISSASLPSAPPSPTVPSLRGKTHSEIIRISDTTCAARFPYNPNDKSLLESFKAGIDGRVWDMANKYWKFPSVKLPAAVAILGGLDYITMTPEVRAMHDDEVSRQQTLNTLSQLDDLPEFREFLFKREIVGQILNWDTVRHFERLRDYIKK